AVTGTGGAAAPCGAIATHRGEQQVAVLLYNSVDAINAGGNSPVTLTLRNLPFRRAMLCTFQIPAPSEAAGMDTDPFAVWDRMGAPDRPTPDQFARMRHHQELMMVDSPREVEIPNDTLSLNLTMDLPSVVLVLLTVDPGTPPERVVDVRAERYEGLDGHAKVLLTWTGTGSRTLRTYEILAARTIDGPVERINVVDQLDTAFLHSLDPAYRVYWVRAIDFWNRGSDLSDPVHITD
ncbi:MAG: hypothetical protein JXC32_09230, partial [Anaerolineae bacterium]|nr:hypothetical protein [Anaerolineae bacterium]